MPYRTTLIASLLVLVLGTGCPPGRAPEGDRDADGDPDETDCGPDDPNAFHGAPDPFGDGIDADCDGLDGKDRDGDGYPGNAPSDDPNADCDDTDETVHPGAAEVCDGVDNDCDGGALDEEQDDDGDGLSECDGDCDDTNDDVHPEAPELCDGLDNDCAGGPESTEVDADADGYMICGGDCDDGDVTVHPGADDVCDGIPDNDCDGETDDDEADEDGDGLSVCDGDCDDDDDTIHPGAAEVCNGDDDDCDGEIPADEADADNDGQTTCEGDCDDDEDTVGNGFPELCDGSDNDCDGIANDEQDGDGDGFTSCDGDCDEGDDQIHPGAPELLDGIDNDCDGVVDEGPCQLVFDGVDDLVIIPAAETPILTGALTVEAWVAIDAAAPVNHSLIAGRWGTQVDSTSGLRLVHDTAAGVFAFHVSPNGTSQEAAVGGTPYTQGAWHHVAGVYDGSRLAVFVDGILDGETPYAGGIFDNGLGLALGDYNPDWIHGAFDFQLTGTIAAVRITDGARYTADFAPAAQLAADVDTLMLLTLDEGVDQIVHDASVLGAEGFLGLTTAAEAEDPTWVCDPENF